MGDGQTSPELIALTLLAAALVLYAWWLSERQARRFRDFVAWIEAHHGARWQALPWYLRRFNPVGGVEHLRRGGLAGDAAFMARYRAGKMVRWPQVVAALGGLAAIGLIGIGVRYFGWTW